MHIDWPYLTFYIPCLNTSFVESRYFPSGVIDVATLEIWCEVIIIHY
jgi:hypothetical protein